MVAAGGTTVAAQKDMIVEASILGINDAYVVIIGIGIIGLILSFFIKRTSRPKRKLQKLLWTKPL